MSRTGQVTTVLTLPLTLDVQAAPYRPFGRTLTQPTNPALHIGYTGHDRTAAADTGLNLIYMNARYDMPGSGRFLSADTLIPDPADSQAFNRYSYVYNNPVKLVDPDGHAPVCMYNSMGCYDPGASLGRNWRIKPALAQEPNKPENMRGVSNSQWDRAWKKYQQVYDLLTSSDINSNGTIKDEIMLAIVIAHEFGTSGFPPEVYNAALEAVSNQYRSFCGQDGCSLREQLLFLGGMEAWYSESTRFRAEQLTDRVQIDKYLEDARKAMQGYDDGDGYRSWTWGHADNEPAGDTVKKLYVEREEYWFYIQTACQRHPGLCP